MPIGRLQRSAGIIATRTSVVLLRSPGRQFENLSHRIAKAKAGLGGTLGVSLLSTVFALRVAFYIDPILQKLGINPESLSNGFGQAGASPLASSLPAMVQSQLASALP